MSEAWLDEITPYPGDVISRAKRGGLMARHRLVAEIAPRRIIEIGVRAGYSACAMLHGAPRASYLGIDAAAGVDGGTPDTIAHARQLLAGFNATIEIRDSHTIDTLPPADLIHVDGDHTHEGCMADLELARRSGIPWILVDDVTLIRAVRKATKEFVHRHRLDCRWLDDGHHGLAVIAPG